MPERPRIAARQRREAGNGATPPRDLTRVLDSIRAIVRTMRLSARAAEETLGVNGAQLFVLQKLGEAPADSLAELASRTHTDPSSVSVVVSRLVARGLVSREASSEDARRITIALTAAGRALLRRAPRAAQTQLADAAAQLSQRQLRALADGLARLAELMAPPEEDDEGERPPTRRVSASRGSSRR